MNFTISKINGEILTNRIMIERLTKDQINPINKKYIEEILLSELEEEEKKYQEVIKKKESQNPYKINMTYFK